jgi:hypothetical protein
MAASIWTPMLLSSERWNWKRKARTLSTSEPNPRGRVRNESMRGKNFDG